MASWKKLFLVPFLLFSLAGCLGLPENASSDELIPETASEDTVPDSGSGTDEFSEFGETNSEPPADTAAAAPTDELQVAPEANSEVAQQPPPENAATDEFSEFEQKESQVAPPQEVAQNEPPAPQTQTPPAADEFDLDSQQIAPAAPQVQQPAPLPRPTPKVEDIDPFLAPEAANNGSVQQAANIKIKSIQYKANDSGGAIVIQADGPINFVTRNNPETEQLIVEIPGAQLPDRLKRPFNMRDIRGAFGSMDPYQQKGSNVARFVVQLRPNATDPFVTAEGDTLLIVADKSQVSSLTAAAASTQTKTTDAAGNSISGNSDKILTSRTLQEFLAENSKFYGKKISIETNSMSVRDALRFISDEGGVNMIIADNVGGNVSLKLRDIPWDQAFVIIMKTKNLGYIRQGNVLRIATVQDLRAEEDQTIKLTTDRIKIEPLVVKVFPINYAKVEDLSGRLKDFLTERGKAIGDPRTNSIVVTDIQQNLGRVEQLIQNLDTQPPQVLIEGRIIEATDSFQRQIGINWGFGGGSLKVGSNKAGEDVLLRPRLSITNGADASNTLGFTLGALDVFGSLNATLALAETENKIRILSSPRIVTLSNERASINQTIQRPYTTITPATASSPAIQNVTFKDLKLSLDVTPQITSDASVIMTIKVQRDLVGETVGNQASIETREANTKVMVKNGQTSVIGGVYQNDSNESISGVPWLKDIPVLGTLFRFKDTRTRRTELMIFLTPRIVSAGSDSIVKPATTN